MSTCRCEVSLTTTKETCEINSQHDEKQKHRKNKMKRNASEKNITGKYNENKRQASVTSATVGGDTDHSFCVYEVNLATLKVAMK